MKNPGVYILACVCLFSGQLFAAPGLTDRPVNSTCVAPDRPPSEAVVALDKVLTQSFPVAMVYAPNNTSRWYVVDRQGFINIYQDGNNFTSVGQFADLTDRVSRQFQGSQRNEMGLLGMAFHPDFAINGYVYLYYSAASSNTPGFEVEARLSRFTSNDNGLTLDPGSELILFTTDRDNQFHWGGQLQFGSDGYLYVSSGDGGRHHNAQNLNTLKGKMLRLDVDGGTPYAIPPDNPHVGTGARPEIYAHGFRNPWRFNFDYVTNDLWLGDVGGEQHEEVNKIVNGGNYGWNILEGDQCTGYVPCNTQGLIGEVFGYDHDPASAFNAVIGGYVYRGGALQNLDGVYIFGDNFTGKVFALRYDAQSVPYAELLIESNQFLTSFAQGPDNELYLLAQQGVYRIINAGAPPPNTFPELLSETGCFTPADVTQPVEGLIPYDVNTPLWSDNAAKQRWMALPDGGTIDLDANGDFLFPVGTVLVKNFSLANDPVETRLFIRHDDGEWAGYSYEWNADLSDAVLLPAGKTKNVAGQTWTYPSRSECMQCHTTFSGRSLGPEVIQLNGDLLYPSSGITANQLETLEHIGMFSAALPDVPANLPALASLGDTSKTLEDRAKSYVHANCSHCHQPASPVQGSIDFRNWTGLNSMGLINEAPHHGNLGVPDAVILSPGNPDKSVMSLRMHALDSKRMPALGTVLEDVTATGVIDSWIQSIGTTADCGPPNYAPANELAVYVWEECGTGRIQTRFTSGNAYARLIGGINSASPLNSVAPFSLEAHDSFDASVEGRIDFNFQAWSGSEDGFDFGYSAGSGACLTIGSPANIPVYWGAAKDLKTSPVDLETLGACGAGDPSNSATLGEPLYSPSQNAGMFLWQQENGVWNIRVTAGNDYANYIGRMTAAAAFPSVTGYSIEAHDFLDFTTDPNKVEFDLQTWGIGEDGITFQIPPTGSVCLEVDQPGPGFNVTVGEENTIVPTPFDVRTLGACGGGGPTETLILDSEGVFDGYIREDASNNGTGQTVKNDVTGSVGVRAGDHNDNAQLIGFVSFPVSQLPVNAVVTSVSLQMTRSPVANYKGDISAFGPLTLELAADQFGASATLEAEDFVATPSLTNVGSLVATGSEGGREIWTGSLANEVNALVESSGRVQLRLRFPLEDNGNSAQDWIGFYSGSHSSVPGRRPKLVIEYTQ